MLEDVPAVHSCVPAAPAVPTVCPPSLLPWEPGLANHAVGPATDSSPRHMMSTTFREDDFARCVDDDDVAGNCPGRCLSSTPGHRTPCNSHDTRVRTRLMTYWAISARPCHAGGTPGLARVLSTRNHCTPPVAPFNVVSPGYIIPPPSPLTPVSVLAQSSKSHSSGAFTCPLFSSTYALTVGKGLRSGVVERVIRGLMRGILGRLGVWVCVRNGSG